MEIDDRFDASRMHYGPSMEQTLTAPLNNTIDFLGSENRLEQTTVSYENILDQEARDLLKHGFKKLAKKNDFIRIADIGDAFRHANQNPTEDKIKEMMERAEAFKKSMQEEDDEDEKPDDRLTYADFLTVVHEFWVDINDDKNELQSEAFDVLDPQNKSKLMVDEFVYLLKTSGWPEDDIELLLSQVNCADGYFIIDDLQRLLTTPVEIGAKKSAKSKKKSK